MSLSIRDLDRWAIEFERQGARVKRTKNGYQVFPVGGGRSFGFHLTASDQNQERQMGRDARKAGLDCSL